jgi:hypothetical protein
MTAAERSPQLPVYRASCDSPARGAVEEGDFKYDCASAPSNQAVAARATRTSGAEIVSPG